MVIVLWSTRNIKCLFSLKYKVAHRSSVIYEGQCSCKLSYIGETFENLFEGIRRCSWKIRTHKACNRKRLIKGIFIEGKLLKRSLLH